MAVISAPNARAFVKIDDVYVAHDQIAYFSKATGEPSDGARSTVHLMNGTTIQSFNLSIGDAVKNFGAIFVPNDGIALGRLAAGWSYEDKENGQVRLTIKQDDPTRKAITVDLKTAGQELITIITNRPAATVPIILELTDGSVVRGATKLVAGGNQPRPT